MKKLTALFTVTAMLVCMFAFAPTASAAERYQLDNYTGEVALMTRTLYHGTAAIDFELEVVCFNGWADQSMGVDHVQGTMTSDIYIPIGGCDASIDVSAMYYDGGICQYEYESGSQTYMAYGFSVVVEPNTTYLSDGAAAFSMYILGYGDFTHSLNASCPTGI